MDASFNVVHVTIGMGLVREPPKPKKGMLLSRETKKETNKGMRLFMVS